MRDKIHFLVRVMVKFQYITINKHNHRPCSLSMIGIFGLSTCSVIAKTEISSVLVGANCRLPFETVSNVVPRGSYATIFSNSY